MLSEIEGEEYNSCTAENWGWELESDCLDELVYWDRATCTPGTFTTGLTSYETSSSNISEDYYLKHEVANDIITASYACYRYTDGVQKEVCLRGGDGGASYGTYDGMSEGKWYETGEPSSTISSITNPTGNIALIESTRSYFEGNSDSCAFYDSYSSCSASSFELRADSDGEVYVVSFSDNAACHVLDGGSSSCPIY